MEGFHSMQEFIESAGDLASLLGLIGSIPGTVIALRQLKNRQRCKQCTTPVSDDDE
ncbi:hypothetical protein [Nonomuraea aridisoli]|uniref:hypothetical protein n=1 Tax=Nonomuraea aridisoli TaxID=2070368 RepID=UPI0015E8EB76|nr:hypothetical protein [Nonomuraea aridisoli]